MEAGDVLVEHGGVQGCGRHVGVSGGGRGEDTCDVFKEESYLPATFVSVFLSYLFGLRQVVN